MKLRLVLAVSALLLPSLILPSVAVSAQAPNWLLIHTKAPYAVVSMCPYGIYVGGWAVYQLQNDGSALFDWYMVTSVLSSQPGAWDSICPPGSQYRNSKHALYMTISVNEPNTQIAEYGPTTTSGSTDVAFSIGVTISESPGIDLGVSIGYSVADVMVLDWTSLDTGRAWWVHQMVPLGAGHYNYVNDNVYTSEPAAVIRAVQGDQFSLTIGYQAAFGTWNGSVWQEFYLPTTNDIVTVP